MVLISDHILCQRGDETHQIDLHRHQIAVTKEIAPSLLRILSLQSLIESPDRDHIHLMVDTVQVQLDDHQTREANIKKFPVETIKEEINMDLRFNLKTGIRLIIQSLIL